MSTYPLVANDQSMDWANDASAVNLVTTTPRASQSTVALTEKNAMLANSGLAYVVLASSGFVVTFPQIRNLSGYSISHSSSTDWMEIWTSTNTTNGTNGTWVLQKAATENTRFYVADDNEMRKVEPLALTGIRGFEVRNVVGNAVNLYGVWIFGTFVPTNALRFWHPTLDVELPATGFDFGDVVRGSMVERQFRVKNMHTLTANNVALNTISQGVGSLQGGLAFSNGGAFSGTLALGTLATGAVSPVITARRTVAPDEPNNVFGRCKITATAASFS